MQNRHHQRGLSILGFIVTAAFVLAIGLIGFRMLPAYIEYYTVIKILKQTIESAREGATPYQLRRDFDLKASADYIDTVRGSDVDFVQEGRGFIATANWTRTLHLVGNVSLLLEFEASASNKPDRS